MTPRGDKRKKLLEQPAVMTVTEEADQVDCPQHLGHSLKVQRDQVGTKPGEIHEFAVCECAVRSNLWYGKVVWERIVPAPSKTTAQAE